METWPRIELQVHYDKYTDLYKSSARTKMPCKVIIIEIAEHHDRAVAQLRAHTNGKNSARSHIATHKCDK